MPQTSSATHKKRICHKLHQRHTKNEYATNLINETQKTNMQQTSKATQKTILLQTSTVTQSKTEYATNQMSDTQKNRICDKPFKRHKKRICVKRHMGHTKTRICRKPQQCQ